MSEKKSQSAATAGSAKKSAKKKSARKASGGSADGKKLVIVESPAKAKTINKYLGKDFVVKASMGHVRDLPPRNPKGVKDPVPGVDLEHDFTPTYKALDGKGKILQELRKAAKGSPEVFLATDLDREGEAIAWHLAEALKLDDDRRRRVVFNEITPSAIKEAFAQPRDLDMNKVNAQQARRILDRIVGYEISPLLWKKVARGLSAGRVQTVAVRLIVEREKEIDAFEPEEYWKISAIFTPDVQGASELAAEWARFMARRDEKGKGPTRDQQAAFLARNGAFQAELVRIDDERFRCDGADRAVELAKAMGLQVQEIVRSEDPKGKGAARNQIAVVAQVDDASRDIFRVSALKTRQSRTRPKAPFKTSTLQQAAAAELHFSARRTMRVAQQLYEGIDVRGEGVVGLITYMRTDSTHLAGSAISQVRELIGKQFGKQYVPDKPNFYSSGGRAQQAHEAIRPTDASRTPQALRGKLSEEQQRLYDLIWRRFVSCQMPPAVWDVNEADISADTAVGTVTFKAMGRKLNFDGFYRVAGLPKGGDQMLPDLAEGKKLGTVTVDPTQHFTQPPPRYTEASLVRSLEAEGIGRPSTYAAIIQTIQDRKYAEIINRAFHPTDLGVVVTEKLIGAFPNVFDLKFTARLEDQLDRVEEEGQDWVHLLREFYGPFHSRLEEAAETMVHAKAETQPAPHTCPECGGGTVYRFGRNGKFLSCANYPDCTYAAPIDKEGNPANPEEVDVACPECGSVMVLRKGRFGPFLSCSRYPECKGVVNIDRKGFVKHPSPPPLQTDLPCPKCEAPVNLRRGKRGPWLSCSKYPKCRGRVAWSKLEPDVQARLEKQLDQHEADHPVPKVRHLDGRIISDQYKPQPAGSDGEDGQDGQDGSAPDQDY